MQFTKAMSKGLGANGLGFISNPFLPADRQVPAVRATW